MSWACTVHKVQGLSLNQVVVSFDLLKQKSFNHGQIYVALSRAKSLSGLFLIGKFDSSTITVDLRASNEYATLREASCLFLEVEEHKENLLSMSCCNVRSLKKHVLKEVSKSCSARLFPVGSSVNKDRNGYNRI